MSSSALSLNNPFVRSRGIWLSYGFNVCFGFALSLIGPLMPFLAAKLDLSFTQIGYHFSLMSAGIVAFSLIGDRVAKRVNSDVLIWSGAVIVGAALFGVTYGASIAVTMPSIFLFGCGIGAIALISNTAIAISAGAHSAKAYTEANIAGGTALIFGPVFVGLISQSPFGWQATACLPLIVVGIVKVIYWGVPIPVAQRRGESPNSANSGDNHPLPPLFWIFGILMFLSVAIEWLISSLGSSFLTTVVGFDVSTAASLMSVFAAAIVVGRLIGRRLLDFMSESRLLILSLVWVLLVFPIYWLSPLPILNVAGLFLFGLGVGNLAPLSMSGAMSSVTEVTNRASARLGIFPSLATLTMVQLLSILADQFGIQRAYGFMIIVVGLAIVITLSTSRLRTAKT